MNKKIFKAFNLSNDMLNIFTDYCFKLDKYFNLEENKDKHFELYMEYQSLNDNLKNVIKKNGFDKK